MQRAAVAILFVVLEVCCGSGGGGGELAWLWGKGPDSLIPSRRLQHRHSFLLLVISPTCLISLLRPREDGILQASYARKPSVSAH
jgi:hypothetical protein